MLIVTIFVAFVCGSIGARIGGRKSGCLGACMVGLVGSYLGQYFHLNFLQNVSLPISFQLPGTDIDILKQIFWNIVGASVLIIIMNLILGPQKK